MQLSVITDEISQDFEHALTVMQEYGANGAELRGLWGTNIADLSEEQVQRAQAALRAHNVRVACLATPFFKCDLHTQDSDGSASGPLHLANPRPLEAQMALLRRCIQLAHTFETPLIRVFSFWRKEAYTPEIEAQIVDAFAEPLALAEKEGVTLVLENEYACFVGTGAEAARLAAEINSPHFKICWDPGNAFAAGERPFPEGYEAARPWLGHVHIKDCRTVETPHHGLQPQWCVVGEGEIEYGGQFAALKRDNYNGWVSLETHYVPATGSGLNGKGVPEDGSRPSLDALRRFILH